MSKRRKTLEIDIVRAKMLESPPPPLSGMTMRQWFAGLAIANSELMKDIPESNRALEAVRLADELIIALESPRLPTKSSMRHPTKKELKDWEDAIKEKTIEMTIRSGDTAPASPRARSRRDAILPKPIDNKI